MERYHCVKSEDEYLSWRRSDALSLVCVPSLYPYFSPSLILSLDFSHNSSLLSTCNFSISLCRSLSLSFLFSLIFSWNICFLFYISFSLTIISVSLSIALLLFHSILCSLPQFLQSSICYPFECHHLSLYLPPCLSPSFSPSISPDVSSIRILFFSLDGDHLTPKAWSRPARQARADAKNPGFRYTP